jgi:hypothetical protein
VAAMLLEIKESQKKQIVAILPVALTKNTLIRMFLAALSLILDSLR